MPKDHDLNLQDEAVETLKIMCLKGYSQFKKKKNSVNFPNLHFWTIQMSFWQWHTGSVKYIFSWAEHRIHR